MKKIRFFALILLFFFSLFLNAGNINVKRIDPPNWWVGMKVPELQLLVWGDNISLTSPVINYKGVKIISVGKAENPNYLFINLKISPEAKPGVFKILFKKGKKTVAKYDYVLKNRIKKPSEYRGFDASDAIYLLMPDRFANGDTTNDNVNSMLEKADRDNPNGRHGGDIKGITEHLDYIKEAGFTAVWINPLMENNMPAYSYHGYAMTDFYKIDPRFGSNDDYVKLVSEAHKKGIKVIQDMVFNHCGTNYFWKDDLPMHDWYNQWDKFTRSNYRAGVVSDPHASKYDYDRMVKGWFDVTMADLNQHNEYVANYLIQNSIWWIETTGLDGIRQDTYPYPYKDFMARWMQRILKEYPEYNVVGEVWMNNPASIAYWLENDRNPDGYHSHLTNVFDFPLMFAVSKAFNESDAWSTGLAEIYDVLSRDFNYSNPDALVVFPDNHDIGRIFTKLGNDIKKWKMAMTLIATVRGIPQIYYGTEILMTGDKNNGDAFIRKDFPGGWPGDTLNAFTKNGRTAQQEEAFEFVKTLFNWRKTKDVIHSGKMKQFIPDNHIYVYFRYNENDKVMVIFNNSVKQEKVDVNRYSEMIESDTKGVSVIDGKTYDLTKSFVMNPKSSLILELK